VLAGQDRRLGADPPGQNDLRDWTLSRVVWVANRGFTSADNRRYLRSGDQHYILGEKLRSGSAEAQAALSRQDRYQDVAASLPVKEVRIAGLSPLANIDGTYGRAISNIGGLWSGPQDDPPAAAALPGRPGLGEGHLVEVDRQVPGGGDGHDLRYRADDVSEGDGARAAAEDFQPGAA
jgi:hypothetical protein